MGSVCFQSFKFSANKLFFKESAIIKFGSKLGQTRSQYFNIYLTTAVPSTQVNILS